MSLIERLTKHVADLSLFYTKLHNYHWHIGGKEFMLIHQMTESYYDEIADNYDALAERILQLGGTAPASVKEYLSLAGIKEEAKKEFTAQEVLSSLKADFEYLLTELRQTRALAADSNDTSTDALLTDIIISFEKKVWMITASLK